MTRDGECFLGCPSIGPTAADPIVFDLSAVQENWSFRKELTSRDPFEIVIDLRDADAFNRRLGCFVADKKRSGNLSPILAHSGEVFMRGRVKARTWSWHHTGAGLEVQSPARVAASASQMVWNARSG